jgi:hypothetical protein
MRYLRPVLLVFLLTLLIVAAWIWGNFPSPIDLADYAPADSVVYLEFNSLPKVIEAVEQTDVWRSVAPITHTRSTPQQRWLKTAAQLGIGSGATVIFTRAQVALVVLSLDSSEQESSVAVRPEFALIVETHTANWRTRPVAIEAVKRLSTFAYGAANCTERSADAEYIECSAPGSERKIVGAIDGTLVVIGNSEKAVHSCLDVRRGVRPSIRTDGEMLKVRRELLSDASLGFGYISSSNSAKLLSLATPLMLGRVPSDGQFERLLQTSASKILRGAAWTATSTGGSIDDRYLFALEPDVVSRLQPAFAVADPDNTFTKLVPSDVHSLSLYRSKRPVTAWTSLDSALALKLETLPAVLLSSILKSSLSVYGVGNPKELLNAVSPPLLTLKPSTSAEGSVLLARVVDEQRLRQLLAKDSIRVFKGLEEPQGESEFTAALYEDFVLMGKTEIVRDCLATLRHGQVVNSESKIGMELSSLNGSAAVVTYTNDEARLRSFITTLLRLQGRELTSAELGKVETTIQNSRFSCTETSLNSVGIERKTRSAFGQFSNLTSLIQANTANPLSR